MASASHGGGGGGGGGVAPAGEEEEHTTSSRAKTCFPSLNDYELLALLDYFDLFSLVSMVRTSKRHYLCGHDVMARSSCMRSATVAEPKDVLGLLPHFQSPPNLLIAFSSNSKAFNKKKKAKELQELAAHLPPRCAMLYADHYAIQQGVAFQDVDSTSDDGPEGKMAVVMGSFPEALTWSALLTNGQLEVALDGKSGDDPPPGFVDAMLASAGLASDVEWKVFVVNILPRAKNAHRFITALTKRFPLASVLGGVSGSALTACSHQGIFSSTLGDATLVRSAAVSLMALGGNVPLHTVVSRGVEQISQSFRLHDVAPLAEEQYGESIVIAPSFEPLPAAVPPVRFDAPELLHRVMHALNTQFNDGKTAGLLIGTRHQDQHRHVAEEEQQPFYLSGLSNQDQVLPEGMLLQVYSEFGQQRPNELRIYRMSSKACMDDVPRALSLANQKFAETKQRVMGCLLFTCSARGPEASDFFSQDCYDARTFLSIFGDNVPIIGTYCNGEVGPNAQADANSNTVFRQGHSTMQGFTAVFGIFAAPEKKRTSALNEMLLGSTSIEDFTSNLLRSRRDSGGASSSSV